MAVCILYDTPAVHLDGNDLPDPVSLQTG